MMAEARGRLIPHANIEGGNGVSPELQAQLVQQQQQHLPPALALVAGISQLWPPLLAKEELKPLERLLGEGRG